MSQDERELALKIRFQTAREDIARAKSDLADMDKTLKAINKDNAAFEATALKSVAALQKQAQATAQAKTQALTSSQAFTKLRTEFASIDREKNLKQLADDFSKLPPEIQKSKAAADQLTAALQKLGATQNEVRGVARSISVNNAAADDAGGGIAGAVRSGGRNALQRIGSDIRGLPAIPIPNSNLSTDVFGKMLAVLGGLNPVAVAVTLATAGLVIGLKQATAGIDQFTKAAIASQEEVYTLLKTGTREEVQEAIKAKEQELEIARARISENKRVLDTFNQEVGGVGRAIADALDLGGAQALRVETQKLEEEERALALGLERLGQVSESSEFAARELAAAEEELAKKRVEAAKEALAEANRFLDNLVNSELNARLAADKINEDQAKERIAAAQREQAIIRDLLDRGVGGSEENVKKLNDQLTALGVEVATLTGELPKLRIRDSINETIKALQEQRTAQLELNAALDTINTSLADKAAELESERDKAVGKAQADASKAELDAFKKKQDALAKLDEDAGEKRAKILEDYQKAERKAIRQFNRDSATAVADRDVLAFTQAQERKNDELTTAKEAQKEALDTLNSGLSKQRESIQKAYDEQLVAISDRLAEQSRVAFERYNEQLAQAQQAAAKATQIEQQKYQQQIAVAAQGSAAVNAIFAQFWNTAQGLARNALNSLSGGGGNVFQQIASTVGNLFAGKSLLPSFDSGGRVTRSGLAKVDRDEVILNRRQQQGMGGGFQFSPTINATSRTEIVRQVNAGLHQFLDDAGIA